jgi:hypothetical protein
MSVLLLAQDGTGLHGTNGEYKQRITQKHKKII